MKKNKKKLILLLFAVLCILLSGCTRSERIDYSELDRRLKKEDKTFSFSEKEVFFRDGVYFVFYSVLSEEDMLLTMKENDEGRLMSVTLTVLGGETVTEELKTSFLRFGEALTTAFVPPEDAGKLIEAEKEYLPVLFTECFEKAQSGRYTAELFCDPLGSALIITRN